MPTLRHFPESVDLGPAIIPISVKSKVNMKGVYGLTVTDATGTRIDIRDDLSALERWRTLFHEMLHAISDLYYLGLKERQVRGLEAGFSAFCLHNPEVAKAMTKALT